jgi:hypothetical protein
MQGEIYYKPHAVAGRAIISRIGTHSQARETNLSSVRYFLPCFYFFLAGKGGAAVV